MKYKKLKEILFKDLVDQFGDIIFNFEYRRMVTNFFHPPSTNDNDKEDMNDLKVKEVLKHVTTGVMSDEDSQSGDDKEIRRMHQISDSD